MAQNPTCTVLLVAADSKATEQIGCAMQDSGIDVLRAVSGSIASWMLEEHTADVVVSFGTLPDMSGLKALEHAEKQSSLIGTVLLLQTKDFDLIQLALRAGVHDVLTAAEYTNGKLIERVMRTFEYVCNSRQQQQRISELQLKQQTLSSTNKRLIRLNEEVRKLANTDSLTHLYNRRYVNNFIQAGISVSSSNVDPEYSILLLDIDYFKKINDTLGHDTGDQVLKHLAKLLTENRRDSDIVGRYGGEEFIIAMPDTDRKVAMIAADRIRTTIENSAIDVSNGRLKITTSIGVSSISIDSAFTVNDIGTATSGKVSVCRALIAQADEALYVAKADGRNNCWHYHDLSKARTITANSQLISTT